MTVPDDLSLQDNYTETPVNEPPHGRVLLHGEVVASLRTMIVEGELATGARLPEKVLCEQFGISRTPLREAMRVLASEGLVVLTPNRGATVSEVTADDVDEMFPVMGSLESLAGEMACERITEDQLAEIRALHYQMLLHYRRRELADYFSLNQTIHGKIVGAAANPTLTAMHASLEGRIRRARYMANTSEARWEQAVKEHGEILEALETRDGPRLASILKQHLKNKCATVKESLLKTSPPMKTSVTRNGLSSVT